MKITSINAAVAEARRFLKRYSEWEEMQGRTYENGNQVYTIDTPRENGALRRASLDLSRALADMRRPS